ncbi:hypothetical protein DL95DRAFT_463627 [Leptodontidium sp. 2 PMI_412]|nr:hypothetical protein DL95DRAFT_463627 [Leptodontidium sp. 2 PMI_412]
MGGVHAPGGAQSWSHFANSMSGHIEPQDRYSASALIALGGRDQLAASGAPTTLAELASMQAMAYEHPHLSLNGDYHSWPANLLFPVNGMEPNHGMGPGQ